MQEIQTPLPAVNEIRSLHDQILQAARTSIEKATRIGELLTEIKSGLKHGAWLPWLKENVPFSEVTAQRYMRVHARRDELKSVTLTDLTHAYRELAGPTQTLEDLEAVIERTLPVAIPVYRALTEIRDKRLYRGSHPTFESFVRGSWGGDAFAAFEVMDSVRRTAA